MASLIFEETQDELDARATRLQRAADRRIPRVARLVGGLLRALRASISVDTIEAGVRRMRDRSIVDALADLTELARVQKAEEPSSALSTALRDIYVDGAQKVVLTLEPRLDLINRHAVRYAERQVGNVIAGVEKEASQSIRRIITRSLTEGIAPRDSARLIADTIGLDRRGTQAVTNYWMDLIQLRDDGESVADAARLAGRSRALAPNARGTRSIDQLTRRYADRWVDHRAMTIARTETMRAANAGNVAIWDDARAQGLVGPSSTMRWYTTPDDRACALCISIDGDEVVLIGGEFVSGGLATRHPPLHPMCLPGDALVLARDGVAGAVARPYEGDLTVVTTASGQRLTCTPNHPVLTPSGWVPAGALHIGSDVIRDVAFNTRLDGDHQNRPARIEEVAETVGRARGMAPAPVPVSAEDFHGDGSGSDIAVVWADRLLWDEILDPTRAQHPHEAQLVGARVGLPVCLSADGGADRLLGWYDSAARRGVCGRHLPLALAIAHGGPLDPLGFALVAGFDPGSQETAPDSAAVDAQPLGDPVLRLPADVAVDQVVDVEIKKAWHGMVYNLETPGGWYASDGIVVHNCRCVLSLVASAP